MGGYNKVFTSDKSLFDAQYKAKWAGCYPVGATTRQTVLGTQYIVFARSIRV